MLKLLVSGLDFDAFESSFLGVAELDAENGVVLESLVEGQDTHLAVLSIKSGSTLLMQALARVRPSSPVVLTPGTGEPRRRAVAGRVQSRHG